MTQKTSQHDESCSTSCLDLESEDERTIQDSTLSLSNSNPSNLMVGLSDAAELESETERSLASRVPPELFENILFYVTVNCIPQLHEDQWPRERFVRNRGQPSPVDVLSDLKRCSLVCLFWANRCRKHMFSNKALQIKSYEDAEVFVRHVVRGCPRITSLSGPSMSSSSTVAADGHESKKKTTSFLLHKLQWLFIYGPVPDDFNPAKLDSPHWSVPPSVAVPGSFLLNRIELTNIHLPSFYHVTKYIRHFSCAAYVSFKDLGRAAVTFTSESARLEHGHGDPSTQTGLPVDTDRPPCRHRPASPSTQTGLPVDNNTDRPSWR